MNKIYHVAQPKDNIQGDFTYQKILQAYQAQKHVISFVQPYSMRLKKKIINSQRLIRKQQI